MSRLFHPLSRSIRHPLAKKGKPGSDPLFSLVQLLVHFEGANGGAVITDSSLFARAASITSVTTSNVQQRFGSTSGLFNAASVLSWTLPALGTADVCYEGFYRPDSVASPRILWFTPNYAAGGFELYFAGTGQLYLYSNSIAVITTASALPAATWSHIALVRISGVAYIYVNGALWGSASWPTNITDTLVYASTSAAGYNWVGYQDELRITYGNGRYPGAFTPPAAPFSN